MQAQHQRATNLQSAHSKSLHRSLYVEGILHIDILDVLDIWKKIGANDRKYLLALLEHYNLISPRIDGESWVVPSLLPKSPAVLQHKLVAVEDGMHFSITNQRCMTFAFPLLVCQLLRSVAVAIALHSDALECFLGSTVFQSIVVEDGHKIKVVLPSGIETSDLWHFIASSLQVCGLGVKGFFDGDVLSNVPRTFRGISINFSPALLKAQSDAEPLLRSLEEGCPFPPSFNIVRDAINELSKLRLSMDDLCIISSLYSDTWMLKDDAGQMQLKLLIGGVSGAVVLLVRTRERGFHIRSVVKLGPRTEIITEIKSTRRASYFLQSLVPSVEAVAMHGDRCGLCTQFASHCLEGDVETFYDALKSSRDDRIKKILDQVMVRLPKGSAAKHEVKHLLDVEVYPIGNVFREAAERMKQTIQELGQEPAATTINVSQHEVANPLFFYEDYFQPCDPPAPVKLRDSQCAVQLGQLCYNRAGCWTYTHGDLHGANILVDGMNNAYIINCATFVWDHGAKDLSNLEASSFIIGAEIDLEKSIWAKQAVNVAKLLASGGTLEALSPQDVISESLRKTYAVAKRCREHLNPCCLGLELQIALLRWVTSFVTDQRIEEEPVLQHLALAYAGFLTEQLRHAHGMAPD